MIRQPKKQCSVQDCEREIHAKGFCHSCYFANRRATNEDFRHRQCEASKRSQAKAVAAKKAAEAAE